MDKPGRRGELALRRGWPSMFRSYLHEDNRYRACFEGDWYLTGDIVKRDEEGYYWFVGRADDAIKSSGHLICPFEVESVLLAHPAVADAAVIGIPHAVMHELVKAYIVLLVDPRHPCLRTNMTPEYLKAGSSAPWLEWFLK